MPKKFIKPPFAAALRKTLYRTTGIIPTAEMERRVYAPDENENAVSPPTGAADEEPRSPSSIYSNDDPTGSILVDIASPPSTDSGSVSSDDPLETAQICKNADADLSRLKGPRFLDFDKAAIQGDLLYHHARITDAIPAHVALVKACVAHHFPEAAPQKRADLKTALTEKQLQYLLEPLPEDNPVVIPQKEIAWIACHGVLRFCQMLAAYDAGKEDGDKRFRNEIAALYEGMCWLFDAPPEIFVRESQNDSKNAYYLTATEGVVRVGGHWLDGLVERTRGTFKQVVKRARRREKERREAMRMLGWRERSDGWREPHREFLAALEIGHLHLGEPAINLDVDVDNDLEGGGQVTEYDADDDEANSNDGVFPADDGLEDGYEFA